MRSLLPAVRIFTLLVASVSLAWGGAAAPVSASQSVQDPPPPTFPVVPNEETVFGDRTPVTLGEMMGLEPGAGEPPSPDTSPALGPQRQQLAMPATTLNVDGLSAPTHSTADPPHVDGAISFTHYLQVVDGYLGVFSKSTGDINLVGSKSFDALWSHATQDDICKVVDPNPSYHRGDPAVLYDHLAHHWIISDVAVVDFSTGPFYLCVLVSEDLDPLGNWFRYAIPVGDPGNPWMPDSPELGIWPDGLYIAADMYDCTGSASTCGTATYQGARVWALNKSKMYISDGLLPEDIQRTSLGTGYKGLLPGTLLGPAPTVGTEEYLVSEAPLTDNLEVWKFHVDWIPDTPPGCGPDPDPPCTLESTFTGPAQVAIASYPAPPALIPQGTGDDLDSQGAPVMIHSFYRKIGAVDSIWVAHTVGDGGSPNRAGIRWYQLDVTGGTIASAPAQYGTFFGAADGVHRWIPSLAVDNDGNMAVGYSASSSSTPAEIRAAGRLVTDAPGTLAQGESTLIAGADVQTGTAAWGPHSSMSLDPSDDCTFWYTNMYYAAGSGPDDWTTRISAFKFPGCLIDTINISGNAGIAGAVLHYDNPGPLSAIADGSGDYSFLVPSSWTGEVTPVLPHYFFDPPSREYTGILAHQTAQDYTAHPFVKFAPDDGATVCRTPYIVVKLFLSDLTRNANGSFNSSSVTFKLDGGNVLNLSTIRVPQTAPHVWAHFIYQPSANLTLGPHTAVFTHPEVSGTVTDTWTFTAADIACAPPTLLSALADEQTVELQQAPEPQWTGDASRQSLIAPNGPSSGASNSDSQQQPEAQTGSGSTRRRDRDPERPAASQAGGLAAPGSAQSPQPAQQLTAPAFLPSQIGWTGWTMEPARPIMVYLKRH